MKRFLCFLFSIVFMIFNIGCNNKNNKNSELIIPEGYEKITVNEQNRDLYEGSSVEFDPHFFSQNVTKGIVKEEDWNIVVNRVKKLRIDRFRVMLLPSWLEPLNDNEDSNVINWDNLTTESQEMKSLYKVLDLAEEENISVNLTLWGAEKKVALVDLNTNTLVNSKGQHFLSQGNEGSNWIIGTLKEEEFAENFSAFIQLLINKKGYTCIKEITPINEPCWSYQINGSRLGDFASYAKLCKAIDKRFKDDNIRSKVKFNLSDNTDTRVQWLENTVTELDSIADLYNSHTYIFGYETKNSIIKNWEIENQNRTRSTVKPHVIGEIGSNQNVGSTRQSDIDCYERGVLIARQMLNLFNAGSAGVSYWVLFDQYYGYQEAYAQMMQLGLWKSAKEEYTSDREYYNSIKQDYEVRPQYYAYGLMSRFTEKGDKIFPIEINKDYVVGTAFLKKNGKWVYIFANAEKTPYKISLSNNDNYGSFKVYEYLKDNLPSNDDLIEYNRKQEFENQVLSIELKSNSILLLEQE